MEGHQKEAEWRVQDKRSENNIWVDVRGEEEDKGFGSAQIVSILSDNIFHGLSFFQMKEEGRNFKQ